VASVDQEAPTRTADPVEHAERTRSADEAGGTVDAGLDQAEHRVSERRLPAPLQYRDPGRYEVLEEHGRGGLGRVMRARDRELGRAVAIKELLRPSVRPVAGRTAPPSTR
jgi:hypothetical protein